MVFTFVAFLVCFERPRAPEAFAIGEPVRIETGHGTEYAVLTTLGLETAYLRSEAPLDRVAIDGGLRLLIEPVGWIEAQLTHSADGLHALRLDPDRHQRRQLILRLFTGDLDAIARTASLPVALRGLMRRCVRNA